VFRALRSRGGMDDAPLDFEELLPEYEKEVKNILAEIILQNTDNWMVYQAMFYLITFFANFSTTKNLFLSVLGRLITKTDATEAREFAKTWIAHIADMPTCKSIKLN
ncbi:hypothetical protein KGQ34_02765, partial [Patescibacteria group bacterium]|nr:hypothetical protein [Patescibacteria group bacterium]